MLITNERLLAFPRYGKMQLLMYIALLYVSLRTINVMTFVINNRNLCRIDHGVRSRTVQRLFFGGQLIHPQTPF